MLYPLSYAGTRAFGAATLPTARWAKPTRPDSIYTSCNE